MNKRLLVKIFFLGIIAYFLIDFILHVRITVAYPVNFRFILILIVGAIMYYLIKRTRKKKR